MYIKFGLMKQFVKALPTVLYCFKYLILIGIPSPLTRKNQSLCIWWPTDPAAHEHFIGTISELEKNAWISFKDLDKNFLGNTRAKNYTKIFQKLLESNKALGGNKSIKGHFLQSNLANFPENLGAVSDEQCERFHQDFKVLRNCIRICGLYIWWLTIIGEHQARLSAGWTFPEKL